MDMLQDNPTVDTSALPSTAPAEGRIDFVHDDERFTLEALRPRTWILSRVTRYSTTTLFTVHELDGTWRAYRHDGRVTRLDAASLTELLRRALA
ncbi:hypothetical protein ACEXQB_000860 [Herbiconiux sp. P18]|uniref:hypothetical protein n=1 Tax=Herbiconiux liangxiaofengii TaxID=3342795 RepID=UPI0035BA17E6